MRDVFGHVAIGEPFAQDRHIGFVFETLKEFGVRHRYQSHDTLAVARKHDPLVTVGYALDVSDHAPPGIR